MMVTLVLNITKSSKEFKEWQLDNLIFRQNKLIEENINN